MPTLAADRRLDLAVLPILKNQCLWVAVYDQSEAAVGMLALIADYDVGHDFRRTAGAASWAFSTRFWFIGPGSPRRVDELAFEPAFAVTAATPASIERRRNVLTATWASPVSGVHEGLLQRNIIYPGSLNNGRLELRRIAMCQVGLRSRLLGN